MNLFFSFSNQRTCCYFYIHVFLVIHAKFSKKQIIKKKIRITLSARFFGFRCSNLAAVEKKTNSAQKIISKDTVGGIREQVANSGHNYCEKRLFQNVA
jgi:hypothetical protein